MKKTAFVLILISIFFTLPADTTSNTTFDSSQIKINEVRSIGAFDFIEIYNEAPFALRFPGGWFLVDTSLDRDKAIEIPKGTIIYPGGFLLVIPNNDYVQYDFPGNVPVIWGSPEHNFNLGSNSEVRLSYLSGSGEYLIDFMGWGGDAESWGLYPDGAALSDDLVPTPGLPNIARPQAGSRPSIRINEIQTRESPALEHDFVELYNFGNTAVSMDGFSLVDENGYPKLLLDANMQLLPNEYLVVIPGISEVPENAPKNTTVSSSPEMEYGLGKSDSVTLAYRNLIVDSFAWDDGHHQTIGLYGDNPVWAKNLIPTPGSANEARDITDIRYLE